MEIECGTLGCPPYSQDREISCAVCSLPRNVRGSIYTRWGRRGCPTHSQLIYQGQAAGSHHSSTGSGANPLCLYSTPSYGDHDGKNQNGGRLYGLQYSTRSDGLPTLYGVHGGRVPCAVCYAPDVSVTAVVPAQTMCPPLWLPLYSGFLFAAHFSSKKLNWICVDDKPETFPGSTSSQSYIYPTELECGSINCERREGGYVQDKEASCTTCAPNNPRKSAVYTIWGRESCPSNSRTRQVSFPIISY